MKIAVAQFEPRDADKSYNLSVITDLTRKAATAGAKVISFHEMCITAYTHTRNLDREALLNLAESVPDGPSTRQLIGLAQTTGLTILAGLLEVDHGKVYNTYICVTGEGLVARYRKIHPFINPHIEPGAEYCVFDLMGWKCGILICYDNNIIENVRATSLLGAELIFAPHVTGCTPSAMPGRGYVAHELWENRDTHPDILRAEFQGPKGRGWLMRWLPARAYDNGVFYAFSNPIGYDGDHLKNGNAMILDPYGEILAETESFDAQIATAQLDRKKLELAGGTRYKRARKPSLYKNIIGRANRSRTIPHWMERETQTGSPDTQ
ncbi:nitrilase family protein [Robiginitalea biformata]|uniref:nitrilase family protein n=1 Tax=Robiginitalea biformata TaxID=252307 RepID=UPI003B5BC32A